VIDYYLIYNLAHAIIPAPIDARSVLIRVLLTAVHNGIQNQLEADNNLIVIMTEALVHGSQEDMDIFEGRLRCVLPLRTKENHMASGGTKMTHEGA
jgi:hypothetical protein